jgi:hypothetical protein
MSEQYNLHEYKDVLVSGVDYDFSQSPHENIPHRLYMDWAALIVKLEQAVHLLFIAPPFPESLEFRTESIPSYIPYSSAAGHYMLDWFFCDLMAANNGGLRIGFDKGRRDGDRVRILTLGFHPGVSSTILKQARAPLASVCVWHGEEQSPEIAEIIATHRKACLAGPVPYPAHDDSNDDGKCALCGPMPDDVIVNVSRDDFFLAPTYQLTRRVFGHTPETEFRRCPRCGARFQWIDMPQYYGSGDHCEERFIRVSEEYYPVNSSLNDDSRDSLERAAELEAARAQHAFSILERHFANAGVVVKHSGPPKDWSHFCLLFHLNIDELSFNGMRYAKLLTELLAEIVGFIQAFSGENFTKNLYDMLIDFNARCPWLEPFLPDSARHFISNLEELHSELCAQSEDDNERFRRSISLMSLLEEKFKYSRISDLSISCGSNDYFTTSPWFGYVKCNLSLKDQFTQLPEELLLLTDLETLKVQYAANLDLDYAFTLLSLLPKLRKLHFNNCAIREISPEIKQMEYLYILDLGNNYTYRANSPDQLPNAFTTLPAEIGSLIRLQELDMTSVITFESFPPEITNLSRLIKLSLRGLKLSPQNIELVPNLKYLDLIDSNIKPAELIPLVSKPNGLQNIILKYLDKSFDILKEYNPELIISSEPTSTATGEY